jgi:hypothetical protein
MKRSQYLALLAILTLVAGAIFFVRSNRSPVAIDLLAKVATARKQSPVTAPDQWQILDETMGGETKKAVYVTPPVRLTFEKVLIPDDGWLRLSFGIREGAWEQCTDGVLFNVIVSDGRKADVLVEQLLDPLHNPNDRRWIPINLDLSPYAGQEVDIIFNTRAGAGKSVDTRYDWALLGQPEIYLAR